MQNGAKPDQVSFRVRHKNAVYAWTPFDNAVYRVSLNIIKEMAKYMETVPQVTTEDLDPNLTSKYADVMAAIQEGRKERLVQLGETW